MKHLIQSKFRIFAILAIAAIFGQVSAFAQQKAITGTVLDGTGQPVIGASVMLVGNSTTGTVTDVNGAFSLTVPNGSTLSVSCIGYSTQTFVVGSQSVYNVVLQEDTEFLEETVVIGYGVQRKSDLTGSVSSIRRRRRPSGQGRRYPHHQQLRSPRCFGSDPRPRLLLQLRQHRTSPYRRWSEG